MALQLLARRGAYKAPTARVSSSRRSRPFRLVVRAYLENHETDEQAAQEKARSRVTFQLPHHVEFGQDMCLIGGDPALGEWDVSKCVPMAWHDGDYWTAEAELPAGSKVEYKYVVRAAEDKGGDVLEWQPTSRNLAVQAEGPEVTIRDAWEGESHEMLEGSLPVPAVTVPKTRTVTIETEWIDSPATAEAGSAAAAATGVPPAPAAPFDFPTVFDNTTDLQHAAEEPSYVKDAAAIAGVVVPEAGSASDLPPEMLTAEQIAAPPPPAKTADGNGRKPRRGFAVDRDSKAFGGHGAVAAAAAATSFKAGDWTALPTNELKQVCKEHGLSVKGSRKELLARLHQHEA